MRLDSRAGRDLTASFPEVAEALAEAIPPGRAVALDGELVATGADGAPDFAALQRRLGARPTATLRELVPVSYVLFDLVWLDDLDRLGGSTVNLPYLRRRQLLVELGVVHPRLPIPPHHLGVDPHILLDLARSHGLEGLLAKRLTSTYRSGRSSAWIKHLIRRRLNDAWIGGWTPGPAGGLGALLVGRPGPPPPESRQVALTFIGRVGTGWTAAQGRQLLRRLTELARATSPFSSVPPEYARGARWVRPELSAEVEYHSWTAAGLLRHAAVKSLTGLDAE